MQQTQDEILLLHAASLQEAAVSASFEVQAPERSLQMEIRLDVLRCKLHEEEERRVRDLEEKQNEIQRLLAVHREETATEKTSAKHLNRRLALAQKRLNRYARRNVLRNVWQWLLVWVGVRRQLKSNLSYAEVRERQRNLRQTWGGTMDPSR